MFRTRKLEVSVMITPQIGNKPNGSIQCNVIHGKLPVHYIWFTDNKTVFEADDLLSDINAGEYNIIVIDASNKKRNLRVQVPIYKIPSIDKYIVSHASSDNARDGNILVEISNVTGKIQILWSNNVITDSFQLNDLKPGIYMASIINSQFIHTCDPAQVHIQ